VQLVRAEGARVPAEVETTLYRVVQEALTNVLKHASARQVSIVLERRARQLRLVVEDDGSGFDPDEARSQAAVSGRSNGKAGYSGLGLSGMRERLALIGGSLRIESAHGVGTTLYVQVPLEAEPAAEAGHA
jgi:signal transduction histidine kinase